MQVLFERCCGMDVHKKVVVACLLINQQGREVHKEIRSFGTTWTQLGELVQWLQEADCQQIAMESTGVYWRPIFNLLEDHFEQVLLVNAQHIKAVPGRKTDVKDAEWIAQLLEHGLLRPSFIPPRPQRELRELTRGRKQLVEERTRVVNRVYKLLEDTNIKLASVVSDLMGKSARQMLAALLSGEDARRIAQMGRGALRDKQAALEEALHGQLRDYHRFVFQQHLEHIEYLEKQIAAFDEEITRRIGQEPEQPAPKDQEPEQPAPKDQEGEGEVAREVALPAPEEGNLGQPPPQAPPASEVGYEGYAHVIRLWDAIPGISQRAAQVLVAEIGIAMEHFASADHLASWLGVCPGNRVSAGKRLGGSTTKGNVYARQVLVEAAQAVSHTKETFLGALYRRYKERLGHRRAIIAVAHRIVIILYHLCKKDMAYQEYGKHIVEERVQETRKQRALKELEHQGYTVTLALAASA